MESTNQACLTYELEQRGVQLERQKRLPVLYKGIQLDVGYRIDLLVENQVLVEIKAVNELTAIHEAQILTYLKLSKRKAGLLINFNEKLIKDGLRRFVI